MWRKFEKKRRVVCVCQEAARRRRGRCLKETPDRTCRKTGVKARLEVSQNLLSVSLLPMQPLLDQRRLTATQSGIFTAGVSPPASLVALTVNNVPAMQETWVQTLDREDPLKKETATVSSILA